MIIRDYGRFAMETERNFWLLRRSCSVLFAIQCFSFQLSEWVILLCIKHSFMQTMRMFACESSSVARVLKRLVMLATNSNWWKKTNIACLFRWKRAICMCRGFLRWFHMIRVFIERMFTEKCWDKEYSWKHFGRAWKPSTRHIFCGFKSTPPMQKKTKFIVWLCISDFKLIFKPRFRKNSGLKTLNFRKMTFVELLQLFTL